ncbi:hypothetical protein AFLA_000863 [Aspergillus flavus NRRL3357]|nr:hypothetical protein AFLA_000863 [Aspergillus flavus NRRL3357]
MKLLPHPVDTDAFGCRSSTRPHAVLFFTFLSLVSSFSRVALPVAHHDALRFPASGPRILSSLISANLTCVAIPRGAPNRFLSAVILIVQNSTALSNWPTPGRVSLSVSLFSRPTELCRPQTKTRVAAPFHFSVSPFEFHLPSTLTFSIYSASHSFFPVTFLRFPVIIHAATYTINSVLALLDRVWTG